MDERLTKPIFGIDSYGPTPVGVHHAIGSHFAFRYTSHQAGKAITRDEYETNTRAGIATVVVFEDGATNALLGYDQGRDDAMFAQEQCVAAGMEPSRPITFAVDADVNADLSRIDAYFAGVATVKGKDNCGPYGSFYLCEHLRAQGFKWFSQTVGWSDGHISEAAQLYQYEINLTVDGCGIDYDRAYYADFGQWGYKPALPVDEYDYERFYEGPFQYKGKMLHERALVIEYDKLIKHPRLNAKRLDEIKALLKLDLERIASRASAHRVPGKTLPMEWSAFDRGTRYKLIAMRVKGEVVK
jgi:hypothetical protein